MVTIAVTARQEIEISIQGPGIPPAGERFTFFTKARAETFVKMLNFAYTEGLKEANQAPHPHF